MKRNPKIWLVKVSKSFVGLSKEKAGKEFIKDLRHWLSANQFNERDLEYQRLNIREYKRLGHYLDPDMFKHGYRIL